MKLKLFFISLLILGLIQANDAQRYMPGYIVKQSGDTVHGFIDYNSAVHMPCKVIFKQTKNAPTQKYTALTLKSFSVAGIQVESAEVEIETSPVDLNKVDYDADFKIIKDIVFLQAIVTGRKSLYFNTTDERKTNFYIKENGKFTLLLYKKYFIKKQVLQEMVDDLNEKKNYQIQLKLYMNDCPKIYPEIENTSYDRYSLKNLFIKYYQAKNEDFYAPEKLQSATEIRFTAGYSINNTNFTNTGSAYYAYITDAEYVSSNSLVFGFSLNTFFLRTKRNFSWNNEILFSSQNYEGSYAYQDTLYKSVLKSSDFSINSMLRYTHPVGKLSLFANAGVFIKYSGSQTNELTKIYPLYSTFRTENDALVPDIKKTELGIPLGAGIIYKRFSCELRYNTGSGVSTTTNLNQTTTQYSILFAFKF